MTYAVSIHFFIIALFVGLVALAALNDVREFKIPNRINLAILALYPIHVLAAPYPVDWIGGLIVGAVLLAIGAGLFMVRAMGGGDVKMIAALALWAGPQAITGFVVFCALAGALLSLLTLSRARFGVSVAMESAFGEAAGKAILSSVVPYGAAIAVGGVYVAAHLLGGGRIL